MVTSFDMMITTMLILRRTGQGGRREGGIRGMGAPSSSTADAAECVHLINTNDNGKLAVKLSKGKENNTEDPPSLDNNDGRNTQSEIPIVTCNTPVHQTLIYLCRNHPWSRWIPIRGATNLEYVVCVVCGGGRDIRGGVSPRSQSVGC